MSIVYINSPSSVSAVLTQLVFYSCLSEKRGDNVRVQHPRTSTTDVTNLFSLPVRVFHYVPVISTPCPSLDSRGASVKAFQPQEHRAINLTRTKVTLAEKHVHAFYLHKHNMRQDETTCSVYYTSTLHCIVGLQIISAHFKLKMHQNPFGGRLGSSRTRFGSSQRSPDLFAGYKRAPERGRDGERR